MKLKRLIRSLIKVLAIFLVILMLALAGYLYMADQNEQISESNNKIRADTGATQGIYKNLQLQLNDSIKAMEYYDDFASSRNGNAQNFRRDFARTLLASLRDKDSILDLQFTMDQFDKVGGIYNKTMVALFKSKVTIQLTADTDVDVYNLIKDITQSFPGNVEIISFQIDRLRDVDDNTLLAIGEGRAHESFVKAEIVFEWQGIQDNLDAKKSATPANPSPINPDTGRPNG